MRHLLIVLTFFPAMCWAGGGFDSDIPISNGPCDVMVTPENVIQEIGKGPWKVLKSTDRMKISADSHYEIREFQVLYCRDYDSHQNLIREYVKPMEWYRAIYKKERKQK